MSDDIYQRARADAALHDRLAAAYSGGEGFTNALWWYAHPDADAPDGTPSPMRRITALEERMYSRDAHPESAAEDAAALTALRARFAASRAAVERAIAVASAPSAVPSTSNSSATTGSPASIAPPASFLRSSVAPGHPPTTPDRPPSDEGASDDMSAGEREEPGAPPRVRRWGLPAAAGLVGVLVGAGIALAAMVPLSQEVVGGAGAGATPVATRPGPTNVPWALDILARPQDKSDVPPVLYSTWLDISTFRALGGPAPLYAARDESGHPCLVLVQVDGGYTADCIDDAGFPDSGLEVSGTYLKADPVVSGAGSSADPSSVDATSSTANDVYAEIDVTWFPSGQLEITQKSLVTGS